MPFQVEETTLPGIGKRYEMYLDEDRSIAVVIQSDGGRRVFCRDNPSEDYEEVMELTDPQARTLGLFLVGAYYQPVAARLSEETARGEHIEWYTITEDSPIQHMNKSDMERKTGVKVLGVDRDGEVDSVPGDDFDFEAGDRLMVIGTDEAHDKLNAVLRKV